MCIGREAEGTRISWAEEEAGERAAAGRMGHGAWGTKTMTHNA